MIIVNCNSFAGTSKAQRVDETVKARHQQDQQQLINRLQATEAQYQAILNAIPDFIFRLSRDGNFLSLNGEVANLPCPGEEFTGKNIQNVLPTDIATMIQGIITKTLDTGTLQTCEYQLPTPLEIRDYEARLVVSGTDEVLAIVRDITERKQTEAKLLLTYQELADLNTNLEHQVEERTAELQQKMRELEEIQRIKNVVLHTVAHDLRTSVIGNLMVLENLGMGSGEWNVGSRENRGNSEHELEESTIPNPQPLISVPRSTIDRMIQGNNRQLGMLDSLLEIHSCEEKELTLHRELVPFGGLLEKIITDLQPLLRENQATCKNLLPKDLPLVMVDQVRFEKVVMSLFSYSLQHNPPGLEFTVKTTVEDGMIRTLIQDNGITMSKSECDRLFDLQIRDPQAPCSTAICLKMYLCQQFIQAHGGNIGAMSNPRQGLTFWFTLPSSG
ncbi:PAS domain-containing sensor histidine kinase [Trichormus variabilis]|uniref:PAS domain-containing sensor histidine kinase n=1 Tax=Anabaena variabilis TaxID=264691 RepID=UPI0016236B37|nr:PAS domain-containing sensor histidine kinase [Trichormus variabilis]MBC1258416.1 PAS domain-containing sensor histidine kinase [Trichormus variabilis V5]